MSAFKHLSIGIPEFSFGMNGPFVLNWNGLRIGLTATKIRISGRQYHQHTRKKAIQRSRCTMLNHKYLHKSKRESQL